MMKERLGVAFGLILVSAGAAQAQRAVQACAPVLRPTEIRSLDRLDVQYAELVSIMNTVQSDQQHDFNLTVPIYGVPVKLGYNDAQTRKEYLSQQLHLDWNVNQSRAYMASYIAPETDAAYIQCLKSEEILAAPLVIDIDTSDKNYVVADITIHALTNVSGDVDLDISSNGDFQQGVIRRWRATGGKLRVVVNRTNPGVNFELNAAITQGGHQLGNDAVVIPPLVTVVEHTAAEERRSDFSEVHCGRGGHHTVQAWGPSVFVRTNPEAGERIAVDRPIDTVESFPINGRPDKPMGSNQYKMEIGAVTPVAAEAKAWCIIAADEDYGYRGRIRATILTTHYSTNIPANNGKDHNPPTRAHTP